MQKIHFSRHPLLKKYLLSFNRLNEQETKNGLTYYAFPQRGTTIGFFKQAKITINNNEIVIAKCANAKPQAILLGKYVHPLKITYRDFVEKISIHFTETGIQYFFKNYFEKLAPQAAQVIDLKALNEDLIDLFNLEKAQQILYLESFLLKKILPLSLSKVETAVALILKNPFIKTKAIAEELFIAEKTLNRQFQKYVGCTTSDFKRIVRFKKVLNDYFKSPSTSLTQICYANNFYDASHFYRQITQTTNFSPRIFFKKIQKMGLENHVYIFEEVPLK